MITSVNILGLSMLVVVCSTFYIQKDAMVNGQYQPQILGTWTEVWGTEGWESNVNYVDTLVVDIDQKGHFYMYCSNKPKYRYDKIDFDGTANFSFRMENSSSKESRFFVNYKMRFGNGSDELIGESRNSREEHNFVRMNRIK